MYILMFSPVKHLLNNKFVINTLCLHAVLLFLFCFALINDGFRFAAVTELVCKIISWSDGYSLIVTIYDNHIGWNMEQSYCLI